MAVALFGSKQYLVASFHEAQLEKDARERRFHGVFGLRKGKGQGKILSL